MAWLALIIAIIALIVALRPLAPEVQHEIEQRKAARRKPSVCDDSQAAHIEARQAREREE